MTTDHFDSYREIIPDFSGFQESLKRPIPVNLRVNRLKIEPGPLVKMLEEKGVPIIHADLVAREMINNNEEIKSQIKQAFGEDIYLPNGTLDRKRMAEIIFSDDAAKKTLNHIVHPHVIKYQKDELERLEKSGEHKFAGVEAALIYEAGAESQFDLMVVVAAKEENVIKRLVKRDGLSTEKILRRIHAQMPLSQKTRRADFVINNDGSLDELNHEANRLLFWLNNQER